MSIASKVSAYNRHRKWKKFLQEIAPTSTMKVLDVGFANVEYSPVDNFIEKHYPYPEKLTALGINAPNEFAKRYPRVRAVQYAGGIFPFQDQEFDVCWSNAVIEHVGEIDEQAVFLAEIKRVSRRAFVTTPNKYFPVEPHTRTPVLHYLPKRTFDSYLRMIGKGWATGRYMHLLGIDDLRNLLNLAHIDKYKIIPNRLFGIPLDFVIIF
jgi:hypothetical protein